MCCLPAASGADGLGLSPCWRAPKGECGTLVAYGFVIESGKHFLGKQFVAVFGHGVLERQSEFEVGHAEVDEGVHLLYDLLRSANERASRIVVVGVESFCLTHHRGSV